MTDRFLASLTQPEAERIVESLRMGIPPSDHTMHFTVGRASEIADLRKTLHRRTAKASGKFLLANYGSGKTHLLRVIREMAMAEGYVVSFITMDARGGVRGNRMDQVFEAICRGIELPGGSGRGLLGLLRRAREMGVRLPDHLYSKYYWLDPRDIEFFSNQYQRGGYFWSRGYAGTDFYYNQFFKALSGLNSVAKAVGLKGLVLLVDEFEDIVTNLTRYDYQLAAHHNLFDFLEGEKFSGLSYFAVTPEFVKGRTVSHGGYSWTAHASGGTTASRERLEDLARRRSFELSPPDGQAIIELARTIRTVHAKAYDLAEPELLTDDRLDREVGMLLGISTADRIRQIIEGIVTALDDAVE